MPGILITSGSRLVIPPGGLVIRELEDRSTDAQMTLHVSYEMYPHWLELAREHALACRKSSIEVDALWRDGSTAEEQTALSLELRAGMQASIAAAAAIDGLYGTIKELAPAPQDSQKVWRRNKTPRYAQVCETFRLCSRIGPRSFADLRTQMKQLFSFRDQAIHPTGAARPAVSHPRLPVAVEQRLAMFTATNAINTARSAAAIVGGIAHLIKPEFSELFDHVKASRDMVDNIADLWESESGPKLYDRNI